MAMIGVDGQTEVESTWNGIKEAIRKIQDHDIGRTENRNKQDWMIPEILALIAERRKEKASPAKYKELNRNIRNKCREAKELWLSEKCKEIEALQEKHDTCNVHKKVKEMTGRNSNQQP